MPPPPASRRLTRQLVSEIQDAVFSEPEPTDHWATPAACLQPDVGIHVRRQATPPPQPHTTSLGGSNIGKLCPSISSTLGRVHSSPQILTPAGHIYSQAPTPAGHSHVLPGPLPGVSDEGVEGAGRPSVLLWPGEADCAGGGLRYGQRGGVAGCVTGAEGSAEPGLSSYQLDNQLGCTLDYALSNRWGLLVIVG